MRVIIIVFGVILITGCNAAMLCNYGISCNAYLDESAIRWNQWLGKTKDEYIKNIGPPDRCTTLTSGDEVCEWRKSGISGGGSYSGVSGQSSISSWEHNIIWTYDQAHIARAWSYRGTLGTRSSNDTGTLPQVGQPADRKD